MKLVSAVVQLQIFRQALCSHEEIACASAAVFEKVGPASGDYLVGVRKTALLPTDAKFQIMLNRQEICEKEETLERIVVNSLTDAASACRSMAGCTRFVCIILFPLLPHLMQTPCFFARVCHGA